MNEDNPFRETMVKISQKAKEDFLTDHPKYEEPEIKTVRTCINLPHAVEIDKGKYDMVTGPILAWLEEHCDGKFGVDLQKTGSDSSFLDIVIPLTIVSWQICFEKEKDAVLFKMFWC